MSRDLVDLGSEDLPSVDPVAMAGALGVVIAFPKSKSANLPMALAVAQHAEAFGIWDIPGRPMYAAGFARSPSSAVRAAVLLEICLGWVGVLCFASGRKVSDLYEVKEVLACYQQASMCVDHRAHCHVIINDPTTAVMPTFGGHVSYSRLNFSKELNGDIVERWVLPCKLMSSKIDLQAGHPSSIVDRIQALGVEHGCSICPNFDPEQYKSVGHFVRTVV